MRALRPGDLIADRYRIDTPIARGGMGAVYRATDERVGRAVAIKVLLRELAEDATSIARFEREATAAARLDHPGVVSVLDFGTTDDGISYLVMEHVGGRTLAQELDQERRIAPARAADIVEQALGALSAAHAAGIVHRDLKPGNLMLVPQGAGGREIVKLLDFGVAQLKTGAAYTRLTQAGALVGTPSFMSPEQARGDDCDARTDVYAMGMVLWCCLTGQRAFETSDLAELLVAVQNEVPARADQVAPDVPEVLASIAAKALEKRPEDRYQSAAELASALLAARTGLAATPSAPPIASAHVAAPVTLAAAPPAMGAPVMPAAAPITSTPAPPAQAPMMTQAPMMPAPGPMMSTPAPAASPALWPRVLAVVVVLGLGATALVVAVLGFGLFELEHGALPGISAPPIAAPPAPPPVVAPPVTPPVGTPVLAPMAPEDLRHPDACAHALDCCYAYVEAIEGVDAPCEELVGSSPGDDAQCDARRTEWSATAIARGVELRECL